MKKDITCTLILMLLLTTSSLKAQELLFYCSNTSGTYQVFKKNLETMDIVNISNNESFNYWWVDPSPDQTKLLLMRSPIGTDIKDQFDYENCEMVKTDFDGNNEEVIVAEDANNWSAFGNPHWHPNGERIIMLAQPSDEFFLFTIDPDGQNPQQISFTFSLDPNWSSDGEKIVFVGLNSEPTFPPSFDDFEIYTADYEYQSNSISNVQILTNDMERDHDPCFSPDDSSIVFSSGNTLLTQADLVKIDLAGNNRTALVSDLTTNGGPINWGSNGKIYYHNVDLFSTPFTGKEYDPSSDTNTDLFPSDQTGIISPYYINRDLVNLKVLDFEGDFQLYPNPIGSDGLLHINQVNPTDDFRYNIIDVHGKDWTDQTIMISRSSITVDQLKQGVYLIQFEINSKLLSLKFIKI